MSFTFLTLQNNARVSLSFLETVCCSQMKKFNLCCHSDISSSPQVTIMSFLNSNSSFPRKGSPEHVWFIFLKHVQKIDFWCSESLFLQTPWVESIAVCSTNESWIYPLTPVRRVSRSSDAVGIYRYIFTFTSHLDVSDSPRSVDACSSL